MSIRKVGHRGRTAAFSPHRTGSIVQQLMPGQAGLPTTMIVRRLAMEAVALNRTLGNPVHAAKPSTKKSEHRKPSNLASDKNRLSGHAPSHGGGPGE